MDPTNELLSIKGEMAELRQAIESLRAENRRLNLAVLAKPDFQFDRLKPDLPGFFVRRYGAGGFDKVIVSPGILLNNDGTLTPYAGATLTLTDFTSIYARWDHQTATWETSGGVNVLTATSLPAASTRYIVMPIATVTWSSSLSIVDTITIHHSGLLVPPPLRLRDGIADYDLSVWDQSGWSGALPSGWTQGWVPEFARGHA